MPRKFPLLGKRMFIILLLINFCLIIPFITSAQKKTVSGTVTGVDGSPLTSAAVLEVGTNNGTITDSTGRFVISVNDNAILEISSVGYQNIRVPVSGKSVINVSLTLSNETLNQVVVVGYGTQRKIDVTGSVAQITGTEITKQGVVNPLSGLQGKVPGVQITNNGAPGSSPNILIRGLGTFNGGTAPLYIVDGAWVNNIQFLNPADIETISILKDASSQAIYGVKAANGVIIITTKKGVRGKSTVSYNGTIGWQVANHIPKMADAHEYSILFNELQRASGGTNFLDSSQFGTGTNWFDQTLRNGLITNHNISVNGGGEKSTYNLSLGYLNQEGILKTNKYERFTSNFKQDIKVTNYLTFGYSLIGQYSKLNNPPGGIWRSLYTAPPVLPVRFADGTYGDPGYYGLGSAVGNPQVTLDYNNGITKDYNLNGNVYAEIKFLRNFTWRSSFGGILDQNDYKNFTPIYKANSNQQSTHNTLNINTGTTKNWIIDNTLSYNNIFGDSRVNLMIGQEAQRIYSYGTTGTASDGSLSSNPQTWYLSLGAGGGTVNDNVSLERTSSYFARGTYSYADRYTFTATVRSDASSLFTANSGRATLPSFGVAWILTNEKFMQNQKLFDVLKLKGSWGMIGNSRVPLSASVAQTVSSTLILGNNGTILAGQSVSSAIPPLLRWEKNEGTDVGIEAVLLNNHLNVNVDYYNRDTKNLIFALFVPGSSGFSSASILENLGVVRNRGVEVSAVWNDVIGDDFHYSIGGNVSYNKNEFTKNNFGGNQKFFSGGAASTGGQLGTVTTQGSPIGQFYGYQVIGIFQSAADVANYKDSKGTIYQPNAKPGDFKYAKLSNGGIGAIQGSDRTIIGNPNAKYFYGINTSFGYKQFDLTLDFNGVAGVDIYNANKGLRFGNENFTKDFYNHRWHGSGTSDSYPSVSLGGGTNYYINTWYVESGNYFRIRNVQLGYTTSIETLKKAGISNLRLFVNAQNPVIFTKYTGFSPEIAGGSPGNYGIDNNVYPITATYTFGINLTF